MSVGYAFQAHNAERVEEICGSAFLRKVAGLSAQNGDLDLIEGSNITITPNSSDHTITISASGGTGGDGLGNHSATQNIKLNNYWLSGDGGNEGLKVHSSGDVEVAKSLDVQGDIKTDDDVHTMGTVKAGTPSSGHGVGEIVADWHVRADHSIYAGVNIHAKDGDIHTGSPSSSYGNGDIAAIRNLVVDDDVIAGGSIITGNPSVGYGAGDIVADDDIKADKNVDALNSVTAYRGFIKTGSPASSFSDDDIAATNDLIADGKVVSNGISGIPGGLDVRVYNNTIYYQSSSASTKDNIQNLNEDFAKILNACPKSYNDKQFGTAEIGYIAEEFDQQGLNNLVIYENGTSKAIKYDLISLYILEIIKQQQNIIKGLQTEINFLKHNNN